MYENFKLLNSEAKELPSGDSNVCSSSEKKIEEKPEESKYNSSSTLTHVLPEKRGDLSTSLPVVSVGLATRGQNDHHRLIIPITVGNIQTVALVDSGAETSMVHDAWRESNDFHLTKQEEDSIGGFGANNRAQVSGEVTLQLESHQLIFRPFTFLSILSDQPIDIPVILGIDFLRDCSLNVFLRQRMIRQCIGDGVIDQYFGSEDVPCRCIINNMPCYKNNDFNENKDSILIETPQMKVDISCEYCPDEPNNTYMFEPSGKLQGFCPPGIVDATEFQLMLAVSRRHVKKDEVVGYISTIINIESLSEQDVMVVNLDTKSDKPNDPNDLWKEELEKSPHLTTEQIQSVKQVLQSQKEVFCLDDSDIGTLGTTEHHIELLDNTPVYLKPRRFPDPVAEEIEKQCRELQLLDVIEESSSPYSSPVVPIRKKDGSLRLCIDYRKLNSVTKPDRFPLPNLTDSIYSLYGMKWFTSLDLIKGYYQLNLEESSRELTAFATPRGHWQFKRMPFGLRNAPAAFQREMTQIMKSFPWKNVVVYLDDILIMSPTFEEHIEMVDKVLSMLKTHGVKVKPSKCTWVSQEVEYLGHILGPDGVRKSPAYVEKISDMKKPTTVKELRQFLGLANFQRKFVAHFSTIQKPLSEQTGGRGNRKLVWTSEMEEAFLSVKEKIVEDVLLAFPDYSCDASPLQLYDDASGYGAGACLTQQQGENTRVIAYMSTTFNYAEQRYSTIERELAALRWSVRALRPFLMGHTFELHTDHRPLIYLQNMKILDSRLARTLEDLADFDYTIHYTPGSDNLAADAMSRLVDGTNVNKNSYFSADPSWLPTGLLLAAKAEGGGDCLFDSLLVVYKHGKFKRNLCSTSLELRHLLIDDLLKNHQKYNIMLNSKQKRMLRLMRHPGQLPSVEVLYSFSELFKCQVIVHFGGDVPVRFIAPGLYSTNSCLPSVHLQCLSGVHYNPVVEMSGYTLPEMYHEEMVREEVSQDDVADEGSDDGEEMHVEVKFSSTGWCSRHLHSHFSSLMVKYEEQSLCALLDGGAMISCVAYSIVKHLRSKINHTEAVIIRGLGGDTGASIGTVFLRLRIPEKLEFDEFKFNVVNDCDMPFCVLLGADFLYHYNINMDFSSGLCQQALEDLGVFCNGVTTSENDGYPLQVLLQMPIKEVHIGAQTSGLRFGINKTVDNELMELTSLVKRKDIQTLQGRSPLLRQLRKCLLSNVVQWPKKLSIFNRYKQNIYLKEDIIMYGTGAYIITQNFLVEVMLVLHYQMAHIGRQKLIELVKRHVWNPGMSKIAGDITATCDSYQRLKISSTVAPPITRIQTSMPFEMMCVDLVNIPPVGRYIGCIVAVDHHTKWMSAVPISYFKDN